MVFWRLLERESSNLPPWRELLRVYRRLESSGEIRGGRFVAGFSGEQFALPEAIGLLREIRRRPSLDEWTAVSGVDPLNLAGILTPGPRLAALAGNRLLYRDGVPAATLSGGEVRFVDVLDPATEWFARKALLRGTRRRAILRERARRSARRRGSLVPRISDHGGADLFTARLSPTAGEIFQMLPVELALRTATAAIFLITGLVMLRDRRGVESGPVGGLLALSVAAVAVVSIPGIRVWPWFSPLLLVAMGTPALMWIWVGVVFIDDFRVSWRDGLAWLVLPLVAVVGLASDRPWVWTVGDALSLVFTLLAAWRIAAGLRGDLVERRRRLRPVLAILAVLYAGGIILLNALSPDRPAGAASRLAEAAVLLALALAFALVALRAGRPLFSPPVVEPAGPAAGAAPPAARPKPIRRKTPCWPGCAGSWRRRRSIAGKALASPRWSPRWTCRNTACAG